MPRVSILLPCRNAAAHLPESIASLEAQSFGDFEVLTMDEGSEDRTYEVLYDWAQRDGRVRLLRTRGRGRAAALATLLAAARGELVARLDAHHVSGAERFSAQVRYLRRDSRLAACGVRVRFTPGSRGDITERHFRWLNAPYEPDAIARDIFTGSPIPPATLMVRRSVLLGVGGYRDMGWPADYDLQLRLWAAGYRLSTVPEVLIHARAGSPGDSRVEPGYAGGAVLRCKVHFLRRTLLAARGDAVIIGAGPLARRLARELRRQGGHVLAFVDTRSDRLGRGIEGAQVVAPPALETPGPLQSALLIIALGVPAARDRVRADLTAQGLREMDDFVALA